jgi:hypothetical protein
MLRVLAYAIFRRFSSAICAHFGPIFVGFSLDLPWFPGDEPSREGFRPKMLHFTASER